MSSKLSSIAQAVVDAYDGAPISDFDIGDRIAIAAAIRTAARKVYGEIHYGGLFMNELLAIADELEGIYPEKPDSSVDISDAADAARFRWLLQGRGYFMEESMLCGHGPCSEHEMIEARVIIDEAMEAELQAEHQPTIQEH